MSDKDRIRDRIAKLMAMANDGRGNENEAAAALRMAQSLMIKHGIEMAEVVRRTGRIPGFEWSSVFVPCSEEGGLIRAPIWQHYIAAELSIFTETHVDLIQSPGKCGFEFGGVLQDVAYAGYLMEHMINCGFRASDEYPDAGRRERESIRIGFAIAMCARMKEMKREAATELRTANAMVVVNAKQAERERRYGKREFIETENHAETFKEMLYRGVGANAAQKVGLGRPVEED